MLTQCFANRIKTRSTNNTNQETLQVEETDAEKVTTNCSAL